MYLFQMQGSVPIIESLFDSALSEFMFLVKFSHL